MNNRTKKRGKIKNIHQGDGTASKSNDPSDPSQVNAKESGCSLDSRVGLSITLGYAALGSSY